MLLHTNPLNICTFPLHIRQTLVIFRYSVPTRVAQFGKNLKVCVSVNPLYRALCLLKCNVPRILIYYCPIINTVALTHLTQICHYEKDKTNWYTSILAVSNSVFQTQCLLLCADWGNVKHKDQEVAEGWIVLYRVWLDGLYC